MKKTQNILDKEVKFFNKNKNKYLQNYKGQYVLIKNEAFLGSFTTESEAFTVGVQKFGSTPFLIRRVVENNQIADIPALTVGVLNVSL